MSIDQVNESFKAATLNDDYNYTFKDKQSQYDAVLDLLDSTGFIPEAFIESETNFFYNLLNIDNVFFARSTPSEIVSHIHSLYSCKLQAFNGESLISYKKELDNHAVYFTTKSDYNHFEKRIDDLYLDKSSPTLSFRAEYFSAQLNYNSDPILAGIKLKRSNIKDTVIKCYFVYKTSFSETELDETKLDSNQDSLQSISDSTFFKIASPKSKNLYQEIINDVSITTGPVIKYFPIEDSEEYRVIIGYKQNSTTNYISALSTLANYYNLSTTRKYIENFKNGVTIISWYIKNFNIKNQIELSIYQVIKEASLLYCIPNNIFNDQFLKSELSLQESIYSQCGVIFVTHFLNRLGPEYNKLANLLDPSKSVIHQEVLLSLKKRLRSETYTQNFIKEVFSQRFEIVKKLYRQFADIHYIKSSMEKTLSYQRLSQITPVGSEEDFENLLSRECSQNQHHAIVLRALFVFNKSILKTNFFISTKVALSFRLKPDFLPITEYPELPYGMFFIVGSDFRGFHIRFRDIARGGIRVVKSRSQDAYNVNVLNLFDENYNLANTQQRKNKDIPEGGSKGVILLDPGHAQERAEACFQKYIDSLIDLLIKQHIPNKKESWVDLYNKPEILFLGPDEGTAHYTDWATYHAKSRGAPWWKSFLTGKSPTIGGIPHDEYGMTTLSVRSYVNQIYKKLNIDNSKIKKFQTGGPDGDLGSNEILLSRDEQYVGLVDGSGILADPKGLNKQELLRLAKERKMIEHYDKSLLSSEGYVVLVDDQDVTLPNGEVITSGIAFRNNFHYKIKDYFGDDGVDLYVPCGGRPGAIDTNNVNSLINQTTGKSIVPYFVEGANLFITQSAKVILEKAGCILFKDASTNKGGVTSSSLEVLASLSFDDETFLKDMCVDKDTGAVPQFYQDYVKEVQAKIVKNAENEFGALWKLREETGLTFTELSDKLSLAINKLADELASSNELWNDDKVFRNAVLFDALPPLLIKAIGIEDIITRVPDAYLKAIFATHLASQFVYSRGIDSNPARFLEFISQLRKRYTQSGLL